MCNKDIRDYANERNVFLWQIAAALNMRDNNFSRKLRFELPDEEKTKIKALIDQIAGDAK